MKVSFLGAAGTVTGSCTHFRFDRSNVQFLVDCGMVQGEANADRLNRGPLPFEPAQIDFILLTHAHLDHCGMIPRLVKEGFTGKVLCTSATADIARALLLDAARHKGACFTAKDVAGIVFEPLEQRPDFGMYRMVTLAQDLRVAATRTAHILGAVAFTVSWKDDQQAWNQIVMSGDLGNNTAENAYQPLLARRQEALGQPRYMVVESTYGPHRRDPRYQSHATRQQALRDLVQEALVERAGLLVVPAFAVHRTQELLVDFVEALRAMRVDHDGLPAFSLAAIAQVATKGLPGAGLTRGLKHSDERSRLLGQALLPHFEQRKVHCEEQGGMVTRLFPVEASPARLEELQRRLRLLRRPVQLLVDSPLARRICEIYASELARRKSNDPGEPVHRHRDLASRLGLADDLALDRFLQDLMGKGRTGEALSTPMLRLHIGEGRDRPLPEAVVGLATICLSGSGMCQGGAVMGWLERFLPKSSATFALTGHAGPGTNAAVLKAWMAAPAEAPAADLVLGEARLPTTSIRAALADLGPYYSGHADQQGLCDFVLKPRSDGRIEKGQGMTLFINHGTDFMRAGLEQALRDRVAEQRPGERRLRDILKPRSADGVFDLDAGRWVESAAAPAPAAAIATALDAQLARIEAALARIGQAPGRWPPTVRGGRAIRSRAPHWAGSPSRSETNRTGGAV